MTGLATRIWRQARLLPLLCLGLGLFAPLAMAQDNPFAPAITVNGRVITNFELKQRIIFFSLLQPNADATAEARKSLIEDRLRQFAAEQMGIEVSPEEVAAGMENFAARVNLSADDFIKALAPRGVSAETFRDFVQTGILWRETVRAKYLAKTPVSERQIDRAIAGGIAAGGEVKLLLSEIAIERGGVTDALVLANRIKGDVRSSVAFSAAARVHSAAPNAPQGGQLDWILLADLPPEVAAQLATLEPGEMTDPITGPEAVSLYFLRDRSLTKGETTGAMAVDYLRFVVASGTDTARMTADVDRCEDLMPFGRDLPEEALQRDTVPEAAVPADLAATLRGLDAGETTVITSAAGQTTVLMLCSRQPLTDIAPSRDDVRGQLLNQKMALRAQNFLEELRAEAFITEP